MPGSWAKTLRRLCRRLNWIEKTKTKRGIKTLSDPFNPWEIIRTRLRADFSSFKNKYKKLAPAPRNWRCKFNTCQGRILLVSLGWVDLFSGVRIFVQICLELLEKFPHIAKDACNEGQMKKKIVKRDAKGKQVLGGYLLTTDVRSFHSRIAKKEENIERRNNCCAAGIVTHLR